MSVSDPYGRPPISAAWSDAILLADFETQEALSALRAAGGVDVVGMFMVVIDHQTRLLSACGKAIRELEDQIIRLESGL